MKRRLGTAIALTLAGALVMTGCTDPTPKPRIVAGSVLRVAVSDPFTSANPSSIEGNQSTNLGIASLTGAAFTRYDRTPKLTRNSNFGSIKKLSDKPLKVKFTLRKSVEWSDGTPVDAADLLLAWASGSGVLDNAKPKLDASGKITNEKSLEKKIYFDSVGVPGLEEVTKVPAISDDNRSLTLTYDHPSAGWESAFSKPLVPAHVVMKRAFESKDYSSTKAKRALVIAMQEYDEGALVPISHVWSEGFAVAAGKTSPSSLLSMGPYSVSAIAPDTITLSANTQYKWGIRPGFEKVIVKVIPKEEDQIQALKDGKVDVISPRVNAQSLSALRDIPGITVQTGVGALYEHLDLTFNNGGPFDPSHYDGDEKKAQAVREAFLLSVPQEAIRADVEQSLSTPITQRNSFLQMPGTDGYKDLTANNGSKAFVVDDTAKARTLLTNVYSAKELKKHPVTVRVLFPADDPLRKVEFAKIAASAAEAGFHVVSGGSSTWRDHLGDGSYDAALFGWATQDLTVGSKQTVFVANGSHNLNGFGDKSVDHDFTALSQAVSNGKRRDLTQDIDAALFAEAYGLPLFQYPVVVARDGVVKDAKPTPLPPGIFGNITRWTPTLKATAITHTPAG